MWTQANIRMLYITLKFTINRKYDSIQKEINGPIIVKNKYYKESRKSQMKYK